MVGAGVGGLASAICLASQGVEVTVLEALASPGGKMREIRVGGRPIDAGPTVLTLRRVFDELFEAAGLTADRLPRLHPAEVLARHAWSGGGQLDLYADEQRSAEAIRALAGRAEAAGYLEFCRRARAIFTTLDEPFIRGGRCNPLQLVGRVGALRVDKLLGITPFSTLWSALGRHFRDPRLQQLFGRYATYVGSSPFSAPATLMLIAHVEQDGVWLVEGGMHQLALALERAARALGVQFRYNSRVTRILVERGRAGAVLLQDGERLESDGIIVNADCAALAAGCFGEQVTAAVPPMPLAQRSASAVTWNLLATTGGFPLSRHNVFFSSDYAAEFRHTFKEGRLPAEPTVYVCAQDRDDRDGRPPAGPERLLCLVNAPALGDRRPFAAEEIRECEDGAFGMLERCGLTVERLPGQQVVTTPADFETLFPATGGALYGRASHGWMASFSRPGARSRIPGIYLAGGSVHPGAGVPMAALAGRLAAAALLADRASTRRSRTAATPGGTSTR